MPLLSGNQRLQPGSSGLCVTCTGGNAVLQVPEGAGQPSVLVLWALESPETLCCVPARHHSPSPQVKQTVSFQSLHVLPLFGTRPGQHSMYALAEAQILLPLTILL